jgi:rhamnose transport system ATP-binding protein
MSQPILTLTHISKSFGATRALADAELSLYAGEVTALVGENGAGKSTLVKILAGLHRPDSGEIRIGGRVAHIESAIHARELGISVVHQESVLFDNLSVAENILVDARPTRRGLIDWRTLRNRATAILAELDAPFGADRQVASLAIGEKHLVQIARGLSGNPRIMILDEPTASLSHREVEHLYRIVRQLQAQGCAVLFISHRFEEVFALADRYAVFRDGCAVGAGSVAEATKDELIRLMVGRPVEQLYMGRSGFSPTSPDAVLQVSGLGRNGEFTEVSFSAHAGEILGVYGLVGSGRTEVMQCLFGITSADSGAVKLKGTQLTALEPDDAIRAGLVYVPEDRQQQGAILDLSAGMNIALPSLDKLSRFGVPDRERIAQLARHWIEALEIKVSGPEQRVADLSGGNQQKVVLAKWLATDPAVLVLDEPTKGVDVGAKVAVHRAMRECAARGLAVVMVSSELPEVLGMSDRILVMRRGRVRAEFTRARASAEKLVAAATDA